MGPDESRASPKTSKKRISIPLQFHKYCTYNCSNIMINPKFQHNIPLSTSKENEYRSKLLFLNFFQVHHFLKASV